MASRANITVWNPDAIAPGVGAEQVKRVITGRGHMTKATDTPANTYYLPVLKEAADMQRQMFAPGRTSGRSLVGLGDVVLINTNGDLDAWMTYAIDGRKITIEDGTETTGFATVLVATMDGVPEFGTDTITIKLRDRQAEIDVPLQQTLYAGNNALPAGLEGVATDLKGKRKPWCAGSVQNISPPCVNTAKLIYQVHDGPVADVPGVYDRGIALKTGQRWIQRTAPASILFACAFGNGVYVAVGSTTPFSTGTGIAYSSPDGVTWTSRSLPGTPHPLYAVIFANGLFVAGGGDGATVNVYTSPDGITWTAQTPAVGLGDIKTIAWSPVLALFVAGGDGGYIASSPDGITWTAGTGLGTTSCFASVWGGTMFVITGLAGAIFSSPDGLTWTARTVAIGSPTFYSVTYGAGLFVAVGLQVATSPDGVTWTIVSNSGILFAFAVTFGNSLFVAVGAGSVYTSGDGVSWSAIFVSVGMNPNAVCYDSTNSKFLTASVQGDMWQTGSVAYASLTELQDDTKAPMHGQYTLCSDATGSYFRLGSSPAGAPTCDVLEGASASDRTGAQIWKRALLKGGKTLADMVAADLTTLDAANSAVCGIWIYGDDTIGSVSDRVCDTLGAWSAPDRNGLYRIKQFVAPSGAPTVKFVATDLRAPLEVLGTEDDGKGIPRYQTIIKWGRNYTPQTTDLAAGVTPARRAVVAEEWRSAKSATAGVQAAYLLSPSVEVETLFTTEADALTEGARRQTLFGVRRVRLPLLVEATTTNSTIDFGDVVQTTHKRFGLSGGKLVTVLGTDISKSKKEIMLTVWG